MSSRNKQGNRSSTWGKKPSSPQVTARLLFQASGSSNENASKNSCSGSAFPFHSAACCSFSCAGMNVCEAMIPVRPSQLTINCQNKKKSTHRPWKSTHSKTQKLCLLMELTREFTFLLWFICLEHCLLNVFSPWQFAFGSEIQFYPTAGPEQLFRLKYISA